MKCGSGSRESYIDTDMWIEFHGAIYLCNICVGEMASLMGFLTQEVASGLKQENDRLAAELFEAQRQAAGLRKAVDGLVDAGDCPDPVAHLHPDSVARMVAPSEAPSEPAPRADQDTREGAVGVAGDGGTSPESLHDSDVARLRSDERSDGGTKSEFSLEL